jgi:hypothetical protein
MGRDARRRRSPGHAIAPAPAVAVTFVGAAVVVALLVSAIGAPAGAAEKGTTLAKAPALAQSGHAAFWDCPAKTTDLLVAVNTLTLHSGATLHISFTVRNTGPSSCNYTAPYAATRPDSTSTTLTAGPCGSLGFQVQGARHRSVWPGAQVVNCPALGSAELAAGASVSGTGSWNQDRPNGTRRVAPGTYRLVIDSTHFSFPLHIARP